MLWPLPVLAYYLKSVGLSDIDSAGILTATFPLTYGDQNWSGALMTDPHTLRRGVFAAPVTWLSQGKIHGESDVAYQARMIHRAFTLSELARPEIGRLITPQPIWFLGYIERAIRDPKPGLASDAEVTAAATATSNMFFN